ncbi:PepSY domain-containing protein [Ensifer canadensis]
MMRRNLIAMVCCSLLLSLAPQVGGISAFAKDGRDDDDNSGSGSSGSSGSGGHGGDDSDDDRSGRGGGDDDDDNSGPGGGGDDKDDADDDGNSGSGRRSDQERARDGVEKGRILALKDVLRLVDEDKYGAVIAVDLRNNGEVYRLRTRDRQGTIRNLRINARTGKFMNIFGF